MERISGIQRRLMDPDLPPGDRAAMSKDLETLEMEEAGLRDQIARTAPVLNTGPRRPDFATLSKVQQALDPREALLSFQIAPWRDVRGDFAGGSWLTVITRSAPTWFASPCRARSGRRSNVQRHLRSSK